MYIKVNVSGTSSWKAAKEIYVKVSGAWKSIKEGYIKVGGVWKKFWSGGTLKPENPITIAQSTNTTTYLITLTGTNYAWTPGPPILTYFFEWSTNGGTTWTQLSTGTATNPAYGSSNTYTYSLTASNVSPNVLNTYRFRIHATYGSQVTDSSATTTVQGPTNITNLATGTLLPTSVPLTWGASTGAGRYMVYYGTTSSPSTLYAGTSGLSATVSGLTANTKYYFKVVPITGLTNSTGYVGNDSNIVSATTLVDLANTVLPTISGTLKEGQTITVSNGTWNTTPDSYTYQWLYYDQPSAGFEGYLPITGATSSSYTIPLNYRDTIPGGQYIRARVNAVKSGYTTTSAYSTGQIVAYDVTVPDAPTGLNVTDIGTNRPYNNGQIDLSWTAPANNGGSALTSYRIDRSTDNTTFTTLATITPVNGVLATSYSNINLTSNTTYYYRIYAVNSVGASTSFAPGSAKATTVPYPPTIGTASSSNTYILVTYTANADGGKPINTFTATSSPGSLTGSTSSGAIQVSNVVHNTAYTFTVTATNANGTSTASASSNTAYGVNIGSVSVVSSSSTINTITLNFTKATNSTGTRAYLSGSLDGTTSGTSYNFTALSSSTSYNLGLAGTDTVNGTLYIGPITTGSYSTLKTGKTVTFGTNTSTTGGFNGSINNYETGYTYNISTSAGSVSWNPTTPPTSGTFWGFSVTGLGSNQSATVTVTTVRDGYTQVSSSTTGTSLTAYTVTWSTAGSPPIVGGGNVTGATVSVSPTSSSGVAGTIINPTPIPTLSDPNYNFSRWRDYFTSGGWATEILPGASYTISSNITFYSWWTPKTYMVSYNSNGGSSSPVSASVQYPGTVTLPSPGTKSGSTFAGWYTLISGGTRVGGSGDSYQPTSNIMLYAQWTSNAAPTIGSVTVTSSLVSGVEFYPGCLLTATANSVTGTPAPTLTYQWYKANTINNSSGTYSAQGTSSTQGTNSTWDNRYGYVTVTATNSAGSTSVNSALFFISSAV